LADHVDTKSFSFTQTGKSAIENVIDLFAENMKIPLVDQVAYAHVTVDMDNVASTGEISKSWLASFSVATWMDMTFKCNHCKSDHPGYKSLVAFLNHLKAAGVTRPKFECADCGKAFSGLNSYINHVTKCHHEHLSFR
jgi:hypothetical protein